MSGTSQLRGRHFAALLATLLTSTFPSELPIASAADPGPFRVERKEGAVVISRGGRPVAEYVHSDPRIPRPYFAHIHAPDGTRVSRHHPPREGIDPVDHDQFHPGLWWSFGDLGGVDFWRNKGRVEQTRFSREPQADTRGARFAVEQSWLSPDGMKVCRGAMLCEFVGGETARPEVPGTILLLEFSLRREAGPLVFGPQHEMGLGFRVATPLMVKGGNGRIVGDHDGVNEAANWGKTGTWWDYSGIAGEGNARRRAGILAVAAADNTRSVWAHARDYGFIALNPTGPPPNRKDVPSGPFTVPAGETFRMRFGIVAHATPESAPLSAESASRGVADLLRDWRP